MRSPTLPEAVAIVDTMNNLRLTARGDLSTRHAIIGKDGREALIFRVMDGQIDLDDITPDQALELYWISTKDHPSLFTIVKCIDAYKDKAASLGKGGMIFNRLHPNHVLWNVLDVGGKERVKMQKRETVSLCVDPILYIEILNLITAIVDTFTKDIDAFAAIILHHVDHKTRDNILLQTAAARTSYMMFPIGVGGDGKKDVIYDHPLAPSNPKGSLTNGYANGPAKAASSTSGTATSPVNDQEEEEESSGAGGDEYNGQRKRVMGDLEMGFETEVSLVLDLMEQEGNKNKGQGKVVGCEQTAPSKSTPSTMLASTSSPSVNYHEQENGKGKEIEESTVFVGSMLCAEVGNGENSAGGAMLGGAGQTIASVGVSQESPASYNSFSSPTPPDRSAFTSSSNCNASTTSPLSASTGPARNATNGFAVGMGGSLLGGGRLTGMLSSQMDEIQVARRPNIPVSTGFSFGLSSRASVATPTRFTFGSGLGNRGLGTIREQAIQASHQALVPRGVLFSGTGPVGNGGGRTAGGASASGEGSMRPTQVKDDIFTVSGSRERNNQPLALNVLDSLTQEQHITNEMQRRIAKQERERVQRARMGPGPTAGSPNVLANAESSSMTGPKESFGGSTTATEACNPADMQTTGPGIGGAVRVIKGMGKTSKPKEIVAGLLGRRRSQRLAGSTHGPTAESTTESGSSSQDQVNPTILEDMPEGAHEDDYEEAGTAAEPRGSKRKFRDVDGKDE